VVAVSLVSIVFGRRCCAIPTTELSLTYIFDISIYLGTNHGGILRLGGMFRGIVAKFSKPPLNIDPL
jgi:hypothetical protein